ncbi:hypothetical protein Glove_86g16 [Diversispora epigaea]|uniref:Uncharacterized protein n=1 Tax=Diversispora epigaea TaxID=1348612 RepID=A0A397JAZ2_9GLOM|nr:hypothetical protein Glove_86g16 [Diversispora epigaea]
MSQEIEKIVYCPAGHSSNDYHRSYYRNIIYPSEIVICVPKNILSKNLKLGPLHWIPYDNFQNIEHIADGSVYSAELKGGMKENWNFIKQDNKFALKEIKDSKYDITEFLEMVYLEYKFRLNIMHDDGACCCYSVDAIVVVGKFEDYGVDNCTKGVDMYKGFLIVLKLLIAVVKESLAAIKDSERNIMLATRFEMKLKFHLKMMMIPDQ